MTEEELAHYEILAAKVKKSIDRQEYHKAEWFLLVSEEISPLIAAIREAWRERDTALADLALSRFENGQMQKALVDVCAERDAAEKGRLAAVWWGGSCQQDRDAAIARAEAAEEAHKEALGEERVANSRADMNARFRLAAEAERDAALARVDALVGGVREEREACAKIANLYGHVGVADERISDYDQAEAELARLRALGWTQADFANALKELLGVSR